MRSSVEALLEDLAAAATSERDKGDRFERLVCRFLMVDDRWAARFSNVFRWSDWPGRGGRPDHGIDLVAVDRESGGLVAVQCKFYARNHYLTKPDIDSFLAESGKHPFIGRLIVSTTERWNSAAEAAVQDQQIPVQRIGLADLIDSSIDWERFSFDALDRMAAKPKKQLRPHQQKAFADVLAGFADHDRGKLIMACGTGKTLTSLRLAEQLVGPGGTVLCLVPSIALLSQSLREWSIEAQAPLRTFAVCSDAKVGRDRGVPDEDISLVDLEIPATTDPAKLIASVQGRPQADPDRMTVVFSTYQSIDVIHQAQILGLDRFGLIVCDEAHRTTGATLAGTDESAFVRVHDDAYIGSDKRLYMTATPRIYDDASKAKAGQAEALLASMDDETLYGPQFHRLDFGRAVGLGLLSDYRVLILTVPEAAVSQVMQSALAVNSELNLPDAAKIIGCWNGLAKRGGPDDFPIDSAPMRRAVAFCQDIKTSQIFERQFADVVDQYADRLETDAADRPDGTAVVADDLLRAEVHHVDGGMNILARNAALDWLRSQPAAGRCRLLTNARCLAEGVDVPALDAVIFLNPRKSEVDVVQAVGRVMRQAPGKQYGYIILPIAVPASEKPDIALRNNERYAVIWKVLQALRAHDSRFNAMINQLELNQKPPDQLRVIGVDLPGRDETDPAAQALQSTLPLDWPQWRDAIFAKIVDKVGSRRYWEDWAQDVAGIVAAHTARLTNLVETGDWRVRAAFDRFLAALRANLNASIDAAQAIDMLSQHLITKPVFDALFEDYSFSAHNPVAQVMQGMLEALEGSNLESETAALDKFYQSVRVRVQGIDNAAGKQRVLMELYEKFFRLAFKRTSESLGIVYTPVEIVDFILRGVDDLLRQHFDSSLSDQGVHLLDPFTGTGTFIVRLLESGLIRSEDLARKYAAELHANEILLLAYYIAAANIEVTYHSLAGQADGRYAPFEGIVLTDTFQSTEAGDTLDNQVFTANNDRAVAQLRLPLRVIVGNPPYSVGQTSGNDDNQNLKYPTLDARIERTYAARSTATNKNSLYDSYIRAIRWASDRIGDQGIVAYVSNGGYIDGNTADGLRQTLVAEFSSIYVYNLRGNQRTAGELSRREGGKVFGSGSRSTVAILLLVKRPGSAGAVLHYRDIGDYLSRGQKLAIVADSNIESIPWEVITPNEAGDWINQRNDVFSSYRSIGDKVGPGVFELHCRGLSTGRDAWIYSYSDVDLRAKAERMVAFYNSQVGRADINLDPSKFSWNRADFKAVGKGIRYEYRPERVFVGAYRPFCREHVLYDRQLNDMVYRLYDIFPEPATRNVGIMVMAPRPAAGFAVLAVDAVPDLSFYSYAAQFFPRWTYEPVTNDGPQGMLSFDEPERPAEDGYRRIDNITDHALTDYRQAYGPQVGKDDIFHYVYGLLHSPDYRHQFAADLKKMLPRIPLTDSRQTFEAFVRAGRELMDLHLGYEQVEPWPDLVITGDDPEGDPYDWYRVRKMAYAKRRADGQSVTDQTTIVYNPHISVSGIPPQAQAYKLGSRSALDWIIERHQLKTDNASGIVNDPNDWSREHHRPRHILDLLTRIVTVSLRTVEIVESLPRLDFTPDGAETRE
jgi:predicted helicase